MASHATRRATPLLALVALLALVGASCGDDSGGGGGSAAPASTTSATTTTLTAGQEPSNSAAAALRADLTDLLEESVYLTAETVRQGLAAGGDLDAPAAASAVAAADASASDLADLIGNSYDVIAGNDFLEVWNAHRDALVQHGLNGGGTPDIEDTRQAVVDQLGGLDDDLDTAELSAALTSSDDELVAALTAVADNDPTQAADLRSAADEMPPVADSVAATFADQIALEGDVEDPGAELRANLSGLFQENAYLTGLALSQVAAADDPQSDAPDALATLDAVAENTADIADVIDEFEPGVAADFEDVWGGHIQLFVDYLRAVLADDAEGIQEAQDGLATFRDRAGHVLAEGSGGLSVEAVAEELVPHTESMLAYADALAAQDETAPELLREAAATMPDIARTLAAPLSTATT